MSSPYDSGYESCSDTEPFDWPQIMPNIVPEQTQKEHSKCTVKNSVSSV